MPAYGQAATSGPHRREPSCQAAASAVSTVAARLSLAGVETSSNQSLDISPSKSRTRRQRVPKRARFACFASSSKTARCRWRSTSAKSAGAPRSPISPSQPWSVTQARAASPAWSPASFGTSHFAQSEVASVCRRASSAGVQSRFIASRSRMRSAR
jgi:hypothetical protein